MIPSATSAFHFAHRNRTYYLPFLISPHYLPLSLRPYYDIWLYFELLWHLLTVLSMILFLTVAWKSKAFHINMLIINAYAAGVLGVTNLLTRVFFIQLELEIINLEDLSDFIWPIHLLKNCAWLGLYNYVAFVTLERYAAFRFATDYETNRRVWVSATLIFVNTIITVPVAFLLIFDLLNGAIYSALVCAMSNVSCLAFSRIKARSVINEQRLANFTNVRQYTVSHRWQIKENIRLAKDIRFYLFGCAAQVMFYLPMFFVPPLLFGRDPSWRRFLELSKACFQLICAYGFFLAYVFCTFSIGRHVDYIRLRLGLRTVVKTTPMSGVTQTPDEHFSNLGGWWTS